MSVTVVPVGEMHLVSSKVLMVSLRMSVCQQGLRQTSLQQPVLAAPATTPLATPVQFLVSVEPVVQRAPVALPVVEAVQVRFLLLVPRVLMDRKLRSWESNAHLVAVAVELLTWLLVATKVLAVTVAVAVAPTDLQ
jgi:hypothetical protein